MNLDKLLKLILELESKSEMAEDMNKMEKPNKVVAIIVAALLTCPPEIKEEGREHLETALKKGIVSLIFPLKDIYGLDKDDIKRITEKTVCQLYKDFESIKKVKECGQDR